jgi:gag-polypeptide of LTR copia-type
MSSDKITIQKLKGTSNYEVWSLRVKAFLVKEDLFGAIINPQVDNDINNKAISNIKLLLEDGPLLQIQHIDVAKEAWTSLEKLYSCGGFTSEFLICKELFDTNLTRFSSMKEYLNKVKQLTDQLKVKRLELPVQVIIACVLNNLTESYDSVVSNITQSLRNNKDAYNLESLFANLLDESKRQGLKEYKEKDNKVFYTNNQPYKGKKPYKITKGKYCKYCKLTSHANDNCYFLFPNKALEAWKNKSQQMVNTTTDNVQRANNKAQDERDKNTEILYTNMDTSLIDFDILKWKYNGGIMIMIIDSLV